MKPQLPSVYDHLLLTEDGRKVSDNPAAAEHNR